MALATGRLSSHHPELSSFDDLPSLEDHMDSDPPEDHSSLHFSEEFFSDSSNFPLFDPPFIEEMHVLTGTTHADNMRHIIARIEPWGNEIGLIRAAEELASVLDSIAQCCRVEHRSDLFVREQDAEGIRVQDDASDDELSQQVSEAIERYLEAMHGSSRSIESAITYVRDELHLPWPWLAYELHLKLLMDSYQYVVGIDMPLGYRFDPDDPPAAPFSWTFETRPGETLSAAQRRFTEEANAAVAQLQALPNEASPAELGRIRQDLEQITRRNTRWFYRHRICQERINQLAKTYHTERAGDPDHPTFPDCSCRGTVRTGIKEADRVLGLTPFHF
jgi:hypothetical protein